MRKILASLFITAMLALGLTMSGVAPASAATDCSAYSALGSRVCFDPFTGYGPVIYIYSSANTIAYAFGVTNYAGNAKEQQVLGSSWGNYGSNGIGFPCRLKDNSPASCYAGSFTGSGTDQVMFTSDGNSIAQLLWYGGGGYESYEFVIVS